MNPLWRSENPTEGYADHPTGAYVHRTPSEYDEGQPSDADLVYIIQHLRRETASIFAILRHISASGEITVLARTHQAPRDQPLNPEVPKRDSGLAAPGWQANDDVPDIRRWVWPEKSTVPPPGIYCLLHLVFARPNAIDWLLRYVDRRAERPTRLQKSSRLRRSTRQWHAIRECGGGCIVARFVNCRGIRQTWWSTALSY